MEQAAEFTEKTVQSEGFHVFDDRTRIWINLHQMWIGNLIGQLCVSSPPRCILSLACASSFLPTPPRGRAGHR